MLSLVIFISFYASTFTINPRQIAPGVKLINFSNQPKLSILPVSDVNGRRNHITNTPQNTDLRQDETSNIHSNLRNRQVIILPDEGKSFNETVDERNSISFPSEIPNKILNESTIIDSNDYFLKCNISQGKIWFKGNCESLLSTSVCSKDHWLLLKEDGQPHCSTRPCPENELYISNKCIDASRSHEYCGNFQIIYTNFAGNSFCDCERDLLYDDGLHKCLPEHSRGSCPFGEILEINLDGRIKCVPHPCKSDDLVLNPSNEICYTKHYFGSCRKSGFELEFDDESNTVTCISILTRNILQVPTLTDSCSPGSRRDYFGKCQEVLRSDGSDPFSIFVPSQLTVRSISFFNACPPNFTIYPDGSCRTVNPLLKN